MTLLATPIVRRIAVRYDVIDHPDEKRKVHRVPVAYLGGIAVFLGLLVAIVLSYVLGDALSTGYKGVPLAVVIGMVAITFTGLADDIWGWDPRLKIAGQLVAAAALAIEDVGVRVAESFLVNLFGAADMPLFGMTDGIAGLVLLNGHLYYWVGTALIAVFVLGGCNSANLIDGLDGLLSGIVGIVALGLLAIALLMIEPTSAEAAESAGGLAGARIVLCVALLGAVLGFLPHNFNPATIFLGDCGSLLLGYMCAVIILMLGDGGKTHLVFAGLIVFSVPIMDTILAIIRRLLAGVPLSAADDQHMHHQLKRGLGGVKRAVFAIYGIGALFAVLGVSLAALVMMTELKVRVVYAIAIVLYSWIGVIAVKEARRKQIALATRPVSRAGGDQSEAEAEAETQARGEAACGGRRRRPGRGRRAGRRAHVTVSGMRDADPIHVLFVCLGNICRSPLAEGVFRHKTRARGVEARFVIDSAGTSGWHEGHPADHRMQDVARAEGVALESRARGVRDDDLRRFDVIVCMDAENLDELLVRGAVPERTHLLLDYDPAAPVREVPDPYYGERDGFEQVYRLVDAACDRLLEHLLAGRVAPDAR